MNAYKQITYWKDWIDKVITQSYNSKDETNIFRVINMLYSIYIPIKKINFLRRKKIYKAFMEIFPKDIAEDYKTKELVKFFCYCSCGIKKDFWGVYNHKSIWSCSEDFIGF